MKKKVLIALCGLPAVLTAIAIYSGGRIRATPLEETQTLPGDDPIPQPLGSMNHAITIHRPPHDVWPWLAQMGSGRAGWCAYELIDNRGQPSAEIILSNYQKIGVGGVLPALPGATELFLVAQCELEHSLVLFWRLCSGKHQTTWAFVLEQSQPGQTRLIVRGRVALIRLMQRNQYFVPKHAWLPLIQHRVRTSDGIGRSYHPASN